MVLHTHAYFIFNYNFLSITEEMNHQRIQSEI